LTDQINDIYHNPAGYLDAPANVTGYINHCNVMGQSCTALPNPDSFLWFDPLHPSQRTHQIIAEKFVDVMQGQSEWATYYGEWYCSMQI
jgi:phospholipase/lecithinase/hemolysin